MKNTSIRIALGFATVLAASAALAEEPVDCFYEANSNHALCQSMKSTSVPAKDYSALLAASEESVDCFYESNRWNAACAITPQHVALHDRAE